MFITRKHIDRRSVLRGMGASIALPLLDAMVPAATALANTAGARRVRMGFVYFPHGAVMQHWSPAKTGTDFEMTKILEPAAKHRGAMTIVSGLRNRGGESNTPHAIIAGTWLGCVKPAISHDPRAATTVDQMAAKALGADTAFPSLELATEVGSVCDPAYGCSYGHTVSFRSPTQPLPMEHNPRKVFYRLFGQGDTADERAAITAENGSILDAVAEDAKRLAGRLGPRDRATISDYLESVREIERRIQKIQTEGMGGVELPDAPVGIPASFEEHLKLQFELIALAWQANLTRVASFMMAREVSMRTYNNLGISDAFHPLSHHQENPQKIEKLVTVQNFHTKVFTEFLDRLAATPDGEGTLLDNSIVLFGSNMSNSDKHNNDPLPSAVFGHGAGTIKGGQHLRYPQDTPHANLLLTLLHRAKVEVETVGDSTGTFAEL
ncbi:MAG: DUF1552 domain-containing protein [Pseudomonadota bacterium]|jgi:hypothetical protein|nr:MAG: hypothetical protein DIU62_06850 [Pseudomonadota bacterium]